MGFPVFIKPGWFMIGNHDLQRQLSVLETNYYDACFALAGFESTQGGDIESRSAEEYRRTKYKREAISKLRGAGASPFEADKEATRLLNEHLLADGLLPALVQRSADMTYAKSFLYALDGYAKMLGVIVDDARSPAELKEVYNDFVTVQFPKLIKARNSAHHIEDRVRQKKSVGRGKLADIEVQPSTASDGLFGGMVGVKIYQVTSLWGNMFSTTIDDGTLAEVEVSLSSLVAMRDSLQTVFNLFKWEGDPVVLP